MSVDYTKLRGRDLLKLAAERGVSDASKLGADDIVKILMAQDKKPPKKKRGPKWFKGKDKEKVIADCKSLWAIGGTDGEAATYAEISKFSLCRYLKGHKDVRELRNRLKRTPIIAARKSVVDNLTKDPDFALRYLKIKRKKEFGNELGLGEDDGIPTAIIKFVGSDGKEKERKSGRDHVS